MSIKVSICLCCMFFIGRWIRGCAAGVFHPSESCLVQWCGAGCNGWGNNFFIFSHFLTFLSFTALHNFLSFYLKVPKASFWAWSWCVYLKLFLSKTLCWICPFLHLQEHEVETPYGRIHCTMKGVPKTDRPAILTFHDIGLNRKSGPLFSSVWVKHLSLCLKPRVLWIIVSRWIRSTN